MATQVKILKDVADIVTIGWNVIIWHYDYLKVMKNNGNCLQTFQNHSHIWELSLYTLSYYLGMFCVTYYLVPMGYNCDIWFFMEHMSTRLLVNSYHKR